VFVKNGQVLGALGPGTHLLDPRAVPFLQQVGTLNGVTRRVDETATTASGVPLRLIPSDRVVAAAEIDYVKPSAIDCRNLTRGDVAGRGNSARLTDSGKAIMRLLTFPD